MTLLQQQQIIMINVQNNNKNELERKGIFIIRAIIFIKICDDNSKGGEAGLIAGWSGVAVDKRW